MNNFNNFFDSRWVHPFGAIISGASGAGKTHFVEKLLKNKDFMVTPIPHHILWCYGAWQSNYEKWRNEIKFIEGLPNSSEIPQNSLLIIDDLMAETDASVTQIFTKSSHHQNISIIYIVQNLFSKCKEMRTISLNAHYICLFKNPRDITQMLTLGRQMYPGKSKYFTEAYKDACQRPHGYLLCDLKQSTPEMFRLRTNIFPDENPEVVYVQK